MSLLHSYVRVLCSVYKGRVFVFEFSCCILIGTYFFIKKVLSLSTYVYVPIVLLFFFSLNNYL